MKITSGKQPSAQRVVVYGPEGIGKSTLGSQFPNPVFIDVESGTKQLDVARVEKPSSWSMLISQIEEFTRDHHGYKTLVIDTADAAERLCINNVLAVGQKESIEDFGYGKGFTKVGEDWAKFLNALTELCESGMNVVVLAHSSLKKFEQPDEFGAYDRYVMKLTKQVEPLTKEWADMVLFVNYETLVVKDEKTNSVKAVGGQRVIWTEHHASWDAKNRHGLPAKLTFPKTGFFNSIAHCFGASATPTKAAVRSEPEAAKVVVTEAPKTTTEDKAAFNAPLYDLMERDGITEAEIQAVVAKKGYFPIDTPVGNYPADFVNGSLVACWPKVKAAIIASR